MKSINDKNCNYFLNNWIPKKEGYCSSVEKKRNLLFKKFFKYHSYKNKNNIRKINNFENYKNNKFSSDNMNIDLTKLIKNISKSVAKEKLMQANIKEKINLKRKGRSATSDKKKNNIDNEIKKIKEDKCEIEKILKKPKKVINIKHIEINEIEDVKKINEYTPGEKVKITVLNDNKEYTREAELISYEGKTIIGVSIKETFDIESDHIIKINYNKKESGPSGGMMTSLTVYSYLTDTDLTKGKTVVGTGTIDVEGNVGEIGGVKYKLIGAVKNKADIFLVPNGENYEEAIKIKKEKKYDIKIVGVSTLKDAINELKNN